MKVKTLFPILSGLFLYGSIAAQNLANNTSGGITFIIKYAPHCKAGKDTSKMMTTAPGSAMNIGSCPVASYTITDGTNSYTFNKASDHGCVFLNGKDTWVITTPKKALVGSMPCPPKQQGQ